MIVVIDTQYRENYGAHDWDGEGACPQYWKMKGGSSYKIVGVPEGIDADRVVMMAASEIEHRSDSSETYILGHSVEADDWQSEFERSQMEWDGEIQFPEPTIEFGALLDKHFERAYNRATV